MTSYSNYFSEHLVQSNQNNGQNISLTKPVSTFGWTQNDQTDFVMSNIINIESTNQPESSIIQLAPARQQNLFTDVIIVNRSDKELIIKSTDISGTSTISKLEQHEALYLYITLNTLSGWSFLSFDAGKQNIDVAPLVGGGLVASNAGKISQAIDNKHVNLPFYAIEDTDLGKLLIFNKGDIVKGDIEFSLPSSSSSDLQEGFFLYITNVNADGVFYVSAGDLDRINNNPSGHNFILQRNTTVLFVLSTSVNSSGKKVYSWFSVLNNPSTVENAVNAFSPVKTINSQDYTLTIQDSGSTILMKGATPGYRLFLPDTKKYQIKNGYFVNVINMSAFPLTLWSLGSNSHGYPINDTYNTLTLGCRINYQIVCDGENWYTIGVGDSNGIVSFLTNNSTRNIYKDNFGEVFIARKNTYNNVLDVNGMFTGQKIYINAVAQGDPSVQIKVQYPSKVNNSIYISEIYVAFGTRSQGINPVCLTKDNSNNYWMI